MALFFLPRATGAAGQEKLPGAAPLDQGVAKNGPQTLRRAPHQQPAIKRGLGTMAQRTVAASTLLASVSPTWMSGGQEQRGTRNARNEHRDPIHAQSWRIAVNERAETEWCAVLSEAGTPRHSLETSMHFAQPKHGSTVYSIHRNSLLLTATKCTQHRLHVASSGLESASDQWKEDNANRREAVSTREVHSTGECM